MEAFWNALVCGGALCIFVLFFIVPFFVSGSSSTPEQDDGLFDEDGHLTIKGMAFYDGLDGSFDGTPPDIHADWF